MKKTSLFLSLLLLAGLAKAQTVATEAWARGTVPTQKHSGAFVQLRSADAARLVSASSPVAARVEIHEMAMDDGVMKMRQVQGLDLPAGKTVELKPGGYHLMLMDLKQALQEGEAVPISLVVQRAGKPTETLQLKATVRPLGAKAGQGGKSGHSAH